MIQRFVRLFVLCLLCLPTTALAQSEEDAERTLDSTEWAMIEVRARPFLEVDYGMATPSYEGLGSDFETIGTLEFKLGYTTLGGVEPSVVSMAANYIFASFANPDLGSSGSEGDISSEFNRFGGGNRVGYGYQGQSVGLDLYNQNSLNWTEIEATDYDALDPDAQAVFDRYGSSFRFGALTEAGLKFRFSRALALTAGMEGSVIYPRYVFWPWLGSVMIYTGVQGVVEYFGDDIIASSPKVGPVLYWLLKTGVSLGYYLALRDDMNWPFNSETPLTVATYKLGVSFKF